MPLIVGALARAAFAQDGGSGTTPTGPPRLPLTTGEIGYRSPALQGLLLPSDPSVSERFNDKLPYWLRFSGELRERFEGYSGGGYKPNSSDDYVLYRLRLGMLIAPKPWLKFFGQMQDARVWGRSPAAPPYQNTWDIRQAYVELGDEGTGFALRVGRQELNFGNGRLIGQSWWTNVSRSFDGVRGTFGRGKLRADVFATSVVIVRDGVIDHHDWGNNLYGVYGSIRDVVPNSLIEPYTLWRLQQNVSTALVKPGHLDEYTYGFRWVGRLPENMDYRTEMAVQRGSLGLDEIKAWTGHWALGYTFADAPSTPRVFAEYNYASGGAGDGVTRTFDPIYPTTHDKLGLADQFGWRNIQNVQVGAEFRFGKKWSLATGFEDLWLANAKDALYGTRGSIVAISQNGTAGTHVAEELDVQAIFQPTRQTQIGLGYGHVFTAEFLDRTTPGNDYNFPYALFEYVF